MGLLKNEVELHIIYTTQQKRTESSNPFRSPLTLPTFSLSFLTNPWNLAICNLFYLFCFFFKKNYLLEEKKNRKEKGRLDLVEIGSEAKQKDEGAGVLWGRL